MCAKLTTNTSHQQWRDWVSPDIDYIDEALTIGQRSSSGSG
jgi:hypothetical protein